MKISVIIPTHDRFDSLCRTIDSIRRQKLTTEIEIIVIDDASNPPIPPLDRDIKLLRFDRNVGACVGRNAGVKASTGEVLLFIDDDAETVDEHGLSRVIDWFATNPKLGALGFRQLTSEQQVHYMQPANSDVAVYTGVFFAYGCAIRREAFELVGGLNEEFGYYYEEIEFALKIFAAGYDIIYDPKSIVIHHQDDRHRNWANIHRKTTHNALLSYLIHYPLFMLPALIPKRLHLHARQINYQARPFLADLYYLITELFGRRKYIKSHRQPLSWSKILDFHNLCNNAVPIEELQEVIAGA
jgi:GT2 family glycosyltransferase